MFFRERDRLYNAVVTEMNDSNVTFPNSMSPSTVSKYVDLITSVFCQPLLYLSKRPNPGPIFPHVVCWPCF